MESAKRELVIYYYGLLIQLSKLLDGWRWTLEDYDRRLDIMETARKKEFTIRPCIGPKDEMIDDLSTAFREIDEYIKTDWRSGGGRDCAAKLADFIPKLRETPKISARDFDDRTDEIRNHVLYGIEAAIGFHHKGCEWQEHELQYCVGNKDVIEKLHDDIQIIMATMVQEYYFDGPEDMIRTLDALDRFRVMASEWK